MGNKNQTNLAKGVLIYGIGTFGTKILTFLIVPIYTYYISTSEMGLYDVLIATIGLLTPLITLQISDAAYKWILQNERIDDYIQATLQVLFFNCIVAFCITLLISNIIYIPYAYYFALVLVLSRIFETIQKLLRGLKRQKLFAISGLLYTIAFLSLNLLLIIHFKAGITGLFLSSVIAYFIAVIFIFFQEPRLRVNPLRRIDISLIKSMLSFSIPLIPNYMSWWVINSSDKYIVNLFLGSAANGILAISHKFPTMLQTILGLFNNSWQDASVAETQNNPKYNSYIFRQLYCFAFGLLFPLIPATTLFIMWTMSPVYKVASNYVAFYYIGIVFQAFSSFFGVGYLRNNQTKKAFSTSVYGAAVNALTNIALIRYLGMHAAAISTFLGFFCMWVVRVKQNKKELGVDICLKEFSLLTIGVIAFAVIGIISPIWLNYVLFIIGIILFLLVNRSLVATLSQKSKSFLYRLSNRTKEQNHAINN